jgi:hypothetical protein
LTKANNESYDINTFEASQPLLFMGLILIIKWLTTNIFKYGEGKQQGLNSVAIPPNRDPVLLLNCNGTHYRYPCYLVGMHISLKAI